MQNKKQWYACHFNFLPEMFDMLSFQLFELGAAGIEELEGRAIAYFLNVEESLLQESIAAIFHKMSESGQPALDPNIKILPVKEEDWHAGWRKYFKPVYIGDTFCVRPPWEKADKPAEFEIVLEPKQAFGTGNHATTQLMLQAIVAHRSNLANCVLDVGTGSGILAVAHALLQPDSEIVAIDIDEVAIDNAGEVAAENGVAENIEFHTGTFDVVPQQQFPLIYANLQRHIITPLLPQFKAYLRENGKIFFSGILTSELTKMMTSLIEYEFHVGEQRRLGEWALLEVVHSTHAERMQR